MQTNSFHLQDFLLFWVFAVHDSLPCFHNIIHSIFVPHDVHGEVLENQ